MNVTRSAVLVTVGVAVVIGASASRVTAQQPTPQSQRSAPDAPAIARLVVEPAKLVLKAGEVLPFKITAYDAQGAIIPNPAVRVTGPRTALRFEEGAVIVETAKPDAFYARLTDMAATGEHGTIDEVASPDDNLQAVFKYLVKQ